MKEKAMKSVQRELESYLSRFGEYMLRRKLVPERNAKFYVYWVRMFFSREPSNPGSNLSERIAIFIEELQTQRKEEWQVHQAEHAVRIYLRV